MQKFLKYFFVVIVGASLLGSVVGAQVNINELTEDVANKGGYQTAGVTGTTLSETVGRFIRVLLSLVGTIFLVLMIYAGFLWMTAAGDEGKVEKSMEIIKAAIIGLALVLIGYGLTTFIVGIITSTTGVPGAQVGGGAGNGGFWKSFGTGMKDNWWNYLF
jgi:hypothetical protein